MPKPSSFCYSKTSSYIIRLAVMLYLVSFTSQIDEGESGSASAVLTLPAETFWQPATTELLQELVFGFQGHDVQTIDRVTALMIAESAFADDWSPVVRVESSQDVSPIKGFAPLGAMQADLESGQLTWELAEPVLARYLKVIVVDPDADPFGASYVSARGALIRAIGAASVYQRPNSVENTGSDTEIEPDNDTIAGATMLLEGEPIVGRPNSNGDTDHYRFRVEGPDVSAVSLRLEGLPRVKVNVALLG